MEDKPHYYRNPPGISKPLEIYVDGKLAKQVFVKVRKPIIAIHVETSIPDKLGIGIEEKGAIKIYDKGSEIDPGLLTISFGDYVVEKELPRKHWISVEVPVKHGVHILKVKSRDRGLLYSDRIVVEGIPPEIDIDPLGEPIIRYGEKNLLEFRIVPRNNVPYTISSISATLNDVPINITLNGDKISVEISLDKYRLKNTLFLHIVYKDLEGGTYSLDQEYTLDLLLEPYGIVHQYLSSLDLREKVFKPIESRSLSLGEIDSVIGVIDKVSKVCSELEDKVYDIRNIEPCSQISSALNMLAGYLGDLFKKAVGESDLGSSSRSLDILKLLCNRGIDHDYCMGLGSLEEIYGFLQKINEYYSVASSEGVGVIDRYKACSEALDLCSEASKRGFEISLCSRVRELYGRLEPEYRDLLNRVGEFYKLVVDSLRRFDLKKLFDNLDSLNNICKEIDYRAVECRDLERVNAEVGRIREFFDSIVLKLPSSSGSRIFRGEVVIDNYLGRTLTDLYIDLGRAKYFFEVEDDKIGFPPIYPGMSIDREIRFRAKYRGRLVLPYSICLGGYCVDKPASIEIGVWGRRSVSAAHPVVLLGRGIEGLERYELPIIRGNPLTKPIKLHTYECRSILGVGGFSATMLCIDRAGYSVVVKIPLEAYYLLLTSTDPREVSRATYIDHGALERFSREAGILRELKHPNIVKLIEYRTDPVPMLVLEFCELGDLNRLMAKAGKLDPATALEIIIPITSALAKAHSHTPPIIHRDIKPGNILLTRDYVPKLTDFNIAKVMSTVSKTSRSKAYTEAYAAPEQVLKGHPDLPPPGPYTDVWALGVVLYEILTARKPYEKIENLEEIKTPEPPSKYNKEVPPELDDLIQQMLEPQPQNRPQDTNRLLNQLTQIYLEITGKR